MDVGTFIDKWGGRFSNIATAWQILLPAGLIGVLSGYLAQGVSWIDQFGWFGWWSAGLIGFALACMALFGVAATRLWWLHGSAIRKWRSDVETVNPVEKEFSKKRISISEIAHPITRLIDSKRFVDCEIIGPANLVLVGNAGFSHVSFINVDIVPTKNGARINNVFILKDCEFIGGTITGVTFFAPGNAFKAFEPIEPHYVSLTGDAAIDKRPLQSNQPW